MPFLTKWVNWEAMEVWSRKSLTPSAAGDYSLAVASHDTALLYLSPRHEAAA